LTRRRRQKPKDPPSRTGQDETEDEDEDDRENEAIRIIGVPPKADPDDQDPPVAVSPPPD
jgi:hypothetical protein